MSHEKAGDPDLAERRIAIANHPPVAFDTAEREGGGIFFLLGVRKCGSSLLNAMVNSLANINGVHYVDVAGRFFGLGIPERDWRADPALLGLLAPGNLYGGFRAMPLAFAAAPAYRAARKILLVRDPRDALVSEYFSIAYTHSLPGDGANEGGLRDDMIRQREAAQAAALADFVLTRAAAMNRTMMEYEREGADKLTRLFRYEDVILHKREWLAAMAAHFGWDGGSEGFIEGMMGWADKLPAQEDPRQFVRKVLPGDHKVKLPAETIGKLDAILAPAMRVFGY